MNIPKKFENSKLSLKWDKLLKIRDVCNLSIEEKRASKVIGSSLEAALVIKLSENNQKFLFSPPGDRKFASLKMRFTGN